MVNQSTHIQSGDERKWAELLGTMPPSEAMMPEAANTLTRIINDAETSDDVNLANRLAEIFLGSMRDTNGIEYNADDLDAIARLLRRSMEDAAADLAAAYMDDDLREELHHGGRYANDPIGFLAAYRQAHRVRFGADFAVG